ncbi:hypothetical protein Ancab_033174 [Ancistrocladus abbreviatus]
MPNYLPTVTAGDESVHTVIPEEDGDLSTKSSFLFCERIEEIGHDDGKGFFRGIFEIGDGYINGDGENSLSLLVIPYSSSMRKTPYKRAGMASVGHSPGGVGFVKGLEEAQIGNIELDLVGQKEGSMDSKKALKLVQNEKRAKCKRPNEGPRTWGKFPPLIGPSKRIQEGADDNFLQTLERGCISNQSQPQNEKGGTRGVRRRSLEKIL